MHYETKIQINDDAICDNFRHAYSLQMLSGKISFLGNLGDAFVQTQFLNFCFLFLFFRFYEFGVFCNYNTTVSL